MWKPKYEQLAKYNAGINKGYYYSKDFKRAMVNVQRDFNEQQIKHAKSKNIEVIILSENNNSIRKVT